MIRWKNTVLNYRIEYTQHGFSAHTAAQFQLYNSKWPGWRENDCMYHTYIDQSVYASIWVVTCECVDVLGFWRLYSPYTIGVVVSPLLFYIDDSGKMVPLNGWFMYWDRAAENSHIDDKLWVEMETVDLFVLFEII